jgi:tetratricopeptide (TPR) repeat protein
MHLISSRQIRAACLCILAACILSASTLAAQQPAHTPAFDAARLNNLGTALMSQQLLDRASASFAAAFKADPSLTLAEVNQAIALLYLQRLPEAQHLLDAAALASPSDPHVWYTLGLLYRNQNDPQKALAAFQKVLTLRPNDPDTHYMVASVDLELKDFPAAAAEFRKAIALEPHHASAIFGLARVLRRQGDTAEASATLARFQHISSSKLGFPLSHTYGEEGLYARVEDASLAPTAVEPMIPVTFSESWRTGPSNTTSASLGSACLIDLSTNDQPALLLLSSGTSAVHLYDRSGTTRFAELPAAQTGLSIPGTGLACAVGDFDNDGLPDLALAITTPDHHDRILLFRNLGRDKSGNSKFEDVTAASGITPTNHPSSLTFVDYDHDGDLDLFITGTPTSASGTPNTLWRNNGNKTFTDWTKEAALGSTSPTTAATLSDLNNDRAVDLVVTGQTSAPTFFANNREGPFNHTPLFAAALPPTTSIATLDFNKDGWMDVLLTHTAAPGVTLWRNPGSHTADPTHATTAAFEQVTLPLTGVLSATAAIPIDYDNDGWIDIAALVRTTHGDQLRILRNLGPAGFTDVSNQLHLNQLHLHNPRSLLAADINHTGASDLIVTQSDGSAILLSDLGGNRNHALHITLRGVADNKSAIGTKIEVFSNGLWQKWEDTGQPEILAGLGSSDKADLVRLLWPTGVPQDEIDVAAADTKPITELDRRGSSCPTLFAWNGSRYNFISDVIGAAVIGHWTSPTTHNTPDPDEWIKVDGDQLRQQNGLFSLRFGEPMEEVNFVDQVRLVAIDHPSSTAVYPNEGFLSAPPFAQAKTILATAPHPLRAAIDNNGNNVLPILSASLATAHTNPTYVRDFTNLPFAGFANTHTLTLDIGPWSPNQPLRLLLHGFIEYFSASSMYAAWQSGLTPIPPYIEAQYPNGSWHKVVADMGFPAGLPRTIVVDLTGKLPPNTTRLRITTNLQIYWDQALVDTTRSPASQSSKDLHTTELPLAHANLAFRGYPRQIDGRTPGDLTYNYQQISASGPFVPHRGAYTRYGDVTPLLRSIDDEFVIFGTGEDMDLEFSAAPLPPLPAGWSRDFFFYANGFVKDMDFYEARPFSVAALPFHGMSTYPYPATEHYPTDPAHTAYQLEYNTRFESGTTDRPYQFNYQPTVETPDF